MIVLLGNALKLLDDQGREEVILFVCNQQNPDGGFNDRGGKSDLYYSLFGGMMLSAWNKERASQATESILKLQQFITRQQNSEVPGFIERCCLVLLQKEFKTSRILRIQSFFSLGKSFWKERHSINLSYRSFVLFLTINAVFPFPGILRLAVRRMLDRTTVDQHSPCSEVAAKVFLQKMMNQDGLKEQELLKSFACESGGFKAFSHLQQADMLSTSVALFALSFSEYDLRLLKPASLDFIQQNYADGAFLSGDGDQTADVEYTFYGLLALGVLSV